MAFHVTPEALADIDSIMEYLKRESPKTAQRFDTRLHEVFRSIEEHPSAGRRTNKPQLRLVNTRPYPYLVFYRLRRADVVVLAVRHGARNPRSMPARPR